MVELTAQRSPGQHLTCAMQAPPLTLHDFRWGLAAASAARIVKRAIETFMLEDISDRMVIELRCIFN